MILSYMKNKITLTFLVVSAFFVRLSFLNYTDYISEDAHITYQFARNIARGGGFSANFGDPIYGSTTPLLTILLAIGSYFSISAVLLSRIIAFISVIGGFIFLYYSFENKKKATMILFILSVSARVFLEEMQGMEIPLLFLFSMGSYFGYIKKNPYLSGAMAGLMLWTRVDAVVWVICLFIIYLCNGEANQTIKYFIATSLMYVPWIIFSWLYFGSPIPFTVIAKQVAYGIGNPGYFIHLQRIVSYLSFPIFFGIIISSALILKIKESKYFIFILFFWLNSAQLILSGSTFFDRYFYMITITGYILVGIGLVKIIKERRSYFIITLAFIAILSFPKIIETRAHYKEMQVNRHLLLQEIGVWINENTPEESTVLLEPLGYVGWYADRIMIDEVGLVTPAVVELHRKGVPGHKYYQYFLSDYVIWTCGEGGESREKIKEHYTLTKTFNKNTLKSCYEIWTKKQVITSQY